MIITHIYILPGEFLCRTKEVGLCIPVICNANYVKRTPAVNRPANQDDGTIVVQCKVMSEIECMPVTNFYVSFHPCSWQSVFHRKYVCQWSPGTSNVQHPTGV